MADQNLFILHSRYLKPLAEVDTHYPAHSAWLEKNYAAGKLLGSGRQNPPIGGVLIAQGQSLPEIQSWIKEDPFVQHGLSHYEIIEFKPGPFPRRSKALNSFLNQE